MINEGLLYILMFEDMSIQSLIEFSCILINHSLSKYLSNHHFEACFQWHKTSLLNYSTGEKTNCKHDKNVLLHYNNYVYSMVKWVGV